MRKTNFRKIAVLVSLVLSLLAFVVVPAFADEVPATGVSDGAVSSVDIADEHVCGDEGRCPYCERNLTPDLNDYDDAMDYLDGYTTNKAEDENFAENVKTAMNSVRKTTPLFGKFWALIPPIIAIALALITKEVYSSLFIGIVVGGLMASHFNFTSGMDYIICNGFADAVSGTAGIFVFLVILGIMVVLMNKSGGSAAFGRWAAKNIKSRVGASIATFILGVLIFIDDYFNCLTVGSIMRPVTDTNKISRAKLAYLIDATAAPVCMIAPISSWAAAVSSYAPEGQGLKLFIQAIPYNFYSLLTFVFIIAITLMKFDYGPMKLHESNARNGDLFTSGDRNNSIETTDTGSEKGIVLDIIFPIVVLIVSCIAALLYVGNGNSFKGMNVITAFSDTDATVGLPWGALIALIITIAYYMIRKVISFKESMNSVPKGFKAMVSAIIILTMATALKNMTTLLGAKVYVAMLMDKAASGLDNFLPAIIFLVACVLAFSTGTSWGTFGILIPIVTAMFPEGGTVMIIGISACLAGAVCGDHCSPISDTTIMSSAGAQCDHLNHVSTQLPYAITVAAVSFVNFIIAPFINNAVISLAVAAVMMIAVLFAIKFITVKKAK